MTGQGRVVTSPTTSAGLHAPAGGDTAGTRRVAAWIVLFVSVVVVLLVAAPDTQPPYATTSEAGDGTDLLRRVLVDLGVEVVEGDADELVGGLGPADVAVVLRDQLDAGQEHRLATHVGEGGRLVVAAPASGPAGGQPRRQGVGVSGPPGCDALPSRAVLDARVDGFVGRGAEAVPDLVEVQGEPVATCWADDGAALVAVYDGVPDDPDAGEGATGETVVLGDADILTNEAIMGDPDLAQLATLFLPDGPVGGDGRVVFLVGTQPPPAATGPDGAVPDHLRRGMWLAAAALVLYGLARARRHGRVLDEAPPVEVPASALAGGIAELLERHGEVADAATRVRAGLRTDVAPRLGADAHDPATLVGLVVRATSLPREQVEVALVDVAVSGVDDLVAVTSAGRAVRAALSIDLVAPAGRSDAQPSRPAPPSSRPRPLHPADHDPTKVHHAD